MTERYPELPEQIGYEMPWALSWSGLKRLLHYYRAILEDTLIEAPAEVSADQ